MLGPPPGGRLGSESGTGPLCFVCSALHVPTLPFCSKACVVKILSGNPVRESCSNEI